jgi:16S rRNA processing protein RimM
LKKTSTEQPANKPASQTGWAVLAHLVRPQGRHGEILADILTDFPERFAERKRLFLVPSATATPVAVLNQPAREITLEEYWLHKGRIVLKFAGVHSISDAEALRGLDVVIPASERTPLTDGAVYISDLIGCQVIDLATSPAINIGPVVDVDRDASILAVQDKDRNELLIPFAKSYLVKIDLDARQIEMRLPAGLLAINAPLTEEERALLKAQAADDPIRGE